MNKRNHNVEVKLRAGLGQLYKDERYTDVTINVDGRFFKCHKVVLSAVSEFFNSMFSSSLKEATQQTVQLKDLKPKVFEDFLSFIYGEGDTIDNENVEDLFRLSSMLQIESLQSECQDFLSQSLDSYNCIGVWKLAKVYSSKLLETTSWQYIMHNFSKIADSETEIKMLDHHEFASIVSDNSLNIIDEEHVCRAFITWFQHNTEDKEDFLHDVFKHLRLSLVSLDFILDELDVIQHIHDSPKCLELIRRAIKFHSLPARRQEFNVYRDSFRKNSDHEHMLVVIGRRTKLNGESTMEFIGYNKEKNQWYTMNQIPGGIGDEFATCSYGHNLMITGGTEKSTACLSYSSRTGKWSTRSDLIHGRYRHVMVAVNNSIFVLGGYSFGTLQSIEEYDLFNDTWTSAGDLALPVDAAAASVLGQKVYIFGGWLGFAEETGVIQCYDTVTQTCTELTILPSPTKFARALTVNNRIEIVCSDGKIMSFNPNDGAKIVNYVPNFHRKNFGILRDRHVLYILGGVEPSISDKTHNEDVWRESYSVDGTTVQVVEHLKIPSKLEVHGCFIQVVHKEDMGTDLLQTLDFDG